MPPRLPAQLGDGYEHPGDECGGQGAAHLQAAEPPERGRGACCCSCCCSCCCHCCSCCYCCWGLVHGARSSSAPSLRPQTSEHMQMVSALPACCAAQLCSCVALPGPSTLPGGRAVEELLCIYRHPGSAGQGSLPVQLPPAKQPCRAAQLRGSGACMDNGWRARRTLCRVAAGLCGRGGGRLVWLQALPTNCWIVVGRAPCGPWLISGACSPRRMQAEALDWDRFCASPTSLAQFCARRPDCCKQASGTAWPVRSCACAKRAAVLLAAPGQPP